MILLNVRSFLGLWHQTCIDQFFLSKRVHGHTDCGARTLTLLQACICPLIHPTSSLVHWPQMRAHLHATTVRNKAVLLWFTWYTSNQSSRSCFSYVRVLLGRTFIIQDFVCLCGSLVSHNHLLSPCLCPEKCAGLWEQKDVWRLEKFNFTVMSSWLWLGGTWKVIGSAFCGILARSPWLWPQTYLWPSLGLVANSLILLNLSFLICKVGRPMNRKGLSIQTLFRNIKDNVCETPAHDRYSVNGCSIYGGW